MKESNEFKRIVPTLAVLEDAKLREVIQRYYANCSRAYAISFFAWRNKVKSLRDKGLDDLNQGYTYPYLMPRGVEKFDQIQYNPKLINKFVTAYVNKVSSKMLELHKYHINAAKQLGV